MESIAALVKEYIGLVIYPLVALLLSLIFTRLAIILLPRFGYLDKPAAGIFTSIRFPAVAALR